jgi:hypothetical protein
MLRGGESELRFSPKGVGAGANTVAISEFTARAGAMMARCRPEIMF